VVATIFRVNLKAFLLQSTNRKKKEEKFTLISGFVSQKMKEAPQTSWRNTSGKVLVARAAYQKDK